MGSLHLCQNEFLHYSSEDIEDSIPIRRTPSIRAQAARIVKQLLLEWTPSRVFISTGDHDNPEMIDMLALPQCWETQNCCRA